MGTGGTVQWWHCSVAAQAQWRHMLTAQWRHRLSGGTGSVAALAQWRHWHWWWHWHWQYWLSGSTGSGLPDHDVEAEIVGCGAPLHPVLIEDDNPRDETWGDDQNNYTKPPKNVRKTLK